MNILFDDKKIYRSENMRKKKKNIYIFFDYIET